MAKRARIFLAILLGVAIAAACGSGGGGDRDGGSGDDGSGGDDPAWYEPDPEGRQTEGDLLGSPPEMLVIAGPQLAAAWVPLALHRSLSGVHTEVVVIDQAIAGQTGRDQAEQLRNYLVAAHADGLRYALLGGDSDQLPFRRVADDFTLLDGTYTTEGPTEAYFANLDVDWDADDDGVWGEASELALAALRSDELAVGRVPASHSTEVERYVAKLVRYETDPAGREIYPLLFSDIASSVPILGDIDGAEGVEVTVSEVFPPAMTAHARRLYATQGAATKFGGELLTPDKVAAALDDGYLLAYHNGHGSHDQLTGALDGDFVAALANPLPPVLLSCACLTGNFADVADSASSSGWQPQDVDEDSAGERFVLGAGGGVGYVGSTGMGLGPIGGSQFLHAVFQGLFGGGQTTLGDAFRHGRAHLREVDLTILGTPMTVTDDSERWTQLISILLGDPSLRVWTAAAAPLEVTAPAIYGPGYQQLAVEVRSEAAQPVAGATVVCAKQDDFLIRTTTGADGVATCTFVPYGPAPLRIGVTGPGRRPVFATVTPE
jgi:hypothetical protein